MFLLQPLIGWLLAWLLDKHRALARFGGYRRGVATLVALPLALAFSPLFGPTSGVASWPEGAREALLGIGGGAWRLAIAGWIAALAAPVVWLRPRIFAAVVRYAAMGLAITSLWAGLMDLDRGVARLSELPRPGALRVLRAAAAGTLAPLALGLLPLGYVVVGEQLGAIPAMRRWFRTGLAPGGGWMGSARLKKYTRPLPKNEP